MFLERQENRQNKDVEEAKYCEMFLAICCVIELSGLNEAAVKLMENASSFERERKKRQRDRMGHEKPIKNISFRKL